MMIFQKSDFDYMELQGLLPVIQLGKEVLVFSDDFGRNNTISFNTEITFYQDLVYYTFIFRVLGFGFRINRQCGY